MRKLLVYMKDYKKESFLAPLFKLLEATFELIVPLVIAQIIDVGIQTGDTGFIISRCLLLVGLGVVGIISFITAQYFAAKASVGFAAKLRSTLFKHIQSLSYSKLDTQGTGTLIARITGDINQVQSGMNLALRLLLRSPFVVFGAMIMAFTIDVKAALVFVVTIPLLSIVVFGIMLWSIPMYKKVQARLDKVLGITRENLSGVRVIRAFCKEDEERREFGERNAALTKLQLMVGRVSAAMNPATYIMINLGIAVLIYVGALRVDSGILTQGQVVALYNYMSQILVELIKLANLIITVTKSFASAARIRDVLELDTNTVYSNDKKIYNTHAVEFDRVSMHYNEGAKDALENISFTAEPGEIIGVIGGTGSGKTTLLNILAALDKPSGGTVLLGGKNLSEIPEETAAAFRRDNLGFVFQDFSLLDTFSLEDNICLPLVLAGKSRTEMRDRLSPLAYDLGIETLLKKYPYEVSGGQKQRAAVARALITRPQILLADEPTGALDSRSTDELLKLFGEINASGQTIVMVTHSVRAASCASRVLFLRDGEVSLELKRGKDTDSQFYQRITDALTQQQTGGECA